MLHNKRPISAILALALILSFVLCAACTQKKPLHSAREREMTIGTVQKEIHVGMSQADVVTALGSPNIITRDSEGRETWVYDKIAREASYSSGGAGLFLIIGGISKEYGSYGTTEKTLTVIIKFDEKKRVESFSYHVSKF